MITLPYLDNLPEFHSLGRSRPIADNFATPDITGSVQPFSPEVGQAQMRLGDTIQNFGEQLGSLAGSVKRRDEILQAEESDRINKLRTEEAYNVVRNGLVNLTVGEGGYQHLKGSQIVGNVSPVLKGYLDKYDTVVNDASANLNEEQKASFKTKTNNTRVELSTDFFRHALKEDQQYAEEVLVGGMAVEEQAAGVNWYNPTAVNASKERVRDLVTTAFTGKPDDLIQAKIADSYEKINSAVVSQAMNHGNLEFAKQYMKNNNTQFNIDDLIRYSSKIAEVTEESKVQFTVKELTGDLQQKFLPGDFMRLRSIVGYHESRNRDFDSKGKAIVSSAGALFEMQTMPETAAKPGYGIRPAANGTPAEFNRVGTEKLAAMLKLFGNDLGKALGSYNWGERYVQQAVRKAAVFNSTPSNERLAYGRNKSWLDFAPPGVQKYVTDISNDYVNGTNRTKMPTLIELKKNVDVALAGASPQAIEKAKARVEANYNDVRQSVDQHHEHTLMGLKDKFDSGELQSIADLSTEDRVNLGDKRTALESYIESAKKKQETILELNPEATSIYSSLYHNSKVLMSKSVSELAELAPMLGRDRVNGLIKQRSYYLETPEAEKAATIDSDQFKAKAIQFGWGDGDDDKQQLIILADKAKQLMAGSDKPLNREEKGKLLDNLFMEYKDVKIGERGPGIGRFIMGKDITKVQRGYEIIVPENIKEHIKATMKEASDIDVLDIYLKYLERKQVE